METHGNMVSYFKMNFKNTGKWEKILEKSGKFVSPKEWYIKFADFTFVMHRQ